MKKFAIALITAGLALSATACSTSTQLTTKETCERIQSVVSNPSNNAGKTGLNRLANQLRPIEAVASDDLKPILSTIVEYSDEQAKETPDAEKLADMQSDYQKAGSDFSQFCSAAAQ